MERAAGIEPASSAWKAEVLPLHNARVTILKIDPQTPDSLSFATNSLSYLAFGGGRWIRTTEAFASELQSDPFGRSGIPPKKWSLIFFA